MSAIPNRGRAGKQGTDVRSDLAVEVEVRADGGLELEARSRVDLYYGDAIRDQVRRLLADLGVDNARVVVDDQGALPFTIAARVEAAVRRAGGGQGRDGRPPRTAPDRQPAPRDRQRRSRLYLPGNEPKFFVNAGLYRPDGVILDLEDSVHPDEKDAARLVVRNALRAVDFGRAEVMVRINQGEAGLVDVDAIAPEHPDLILIPKVETAAQVAAVEDRIRAAIGDERPIWLMPILESALGIENALEIARASERVVALTLGLEDLTADLGVVKTKEGSETLWARSRVVFAARAAHLQAIDSVYGDIGDLDGLLAWARASRGLGFEGMGCVHPRQIEVIHRGFAPEAAELERARRIVAAFEEAAAKGLAVVSLGSKMIDPPVVERARKLVARAAAVAAAEGREPS